MSEQDPKERRKFPRVRAPILFRENRLFSSKRPVQDVSIGGLRVYSDETFKIGHMMEAELFLPNDKTITCQMRVVWLSLLPQGSPAKYDVGLEIQEIRAEHRAQLGAIIEHFLKQDEADKAKPV